MNGRTTPSSKTLREGKAHKCLIAGVGRSGTTFLVQLLTELGFDTGFSDAERFRAAYFDTAKAGLEINLLRRADSPYVVKDPGICDYLDAVMETDRFIIDHVFVPVRDLEDAAMSRIRVTRAGWSDGGLWKTDDTHLQKTILAETLCALVQKLARYEIPCTFLEFPRFVTDCDYALRRLAFLTSDMDYAVFCEAFHRTSRPDFVHHFSAGQKKRDLAPPSFANRLARRLRRLLRKAVR